VNTNTHITVLISSNHPVFLDGMKVILGADPAIQLVGEARSLSEATSKVDQLHPDVLLLDIGAGELDAPDAIRQMKQADHSLTVLALCLAGEPASPMEAFHDAGVSTFIQPHMGMQEVVRMIHGSDAAQRPAPGKEAAIPETHSGKARPKTRKIA
jgi:DNA-binding NarL/FixJ family response regulator